MLFTFSAFGGKFKAHYCGDELSAIVLADAKVNEDGCCGTKDDCCTDKEFKVAIDKEFIKEAHNKKEVVFKSCPSHLSEGWKPKQPTYLSFVKEVKVSGQKPPPKINSYPFRVLYCSFLI